MHNVMRRGGVEGKEKGLFFHIRTIRDFHSPPSSLPPFFIRPLSLSLFTSRNMGKWVQKEREKKHTQKEAISWVPVLFHPGCFFFFLQMCSIFFSCRTLKNAWPFPCPVLRLPLLLPPFLHLLLVSSSSLFSVVSSTGHERKSLLSPSWTSKERERGGGGEKKREDRKVQKIWNSFRP